MKSAAVTARIRVVCADVEGLLKRLVHHGIVLTNVEKNDHLTVTIHVKTSDYKETSHLLEQWNVSYSLLDRQETALSGWKILKRSVVLFAVILLLLAAVYLPGKILFVVVTGNETVPSRRILEVANAKGVCFGASAVKVRSEKVKNELLEAIPQLQWIGVNTSGCVATICVEEKNQVDVTKNNNYCVSSVVASTDGIIETCTVTRGTRLCREGQAVKAGDVLISGYTDCGIIIQATQAEGEVFAQTLHKIQTVTPSSYVQKGNAVGYEVNYCLRIGKKLINFDNNSGIYHGSCVKIYEEQYMMLPGGFILPVSVLTETVTYYDTAGDTSTALADEDFLETYSEAYLHSQMIAGEIHHKAQQLLESDGVFILKGQYVCSEMIGRQRAEEILQGELKRD